jgi:hypothetical protein
MYLKERKNRKSTNKVLSFISLNVFVLETVKEKALNTAG